MRVGIVCEGSTDFAVLRVVCGEVLGTKDLSVTLLQPRYRRKLARVPELARFVGKITARARAVRRAAWGGRERA